MESPVHMEETMTSGDKDKEEPLIVMEKKASVDPSGRLKGELQQLKGGYKRLKQELLYQYTKHMLLTMCASETTPDPAQSEKELKEKSEALDKAKTNLQSLVTTLEGLTQQSEKCYLEYEERAKALEREKEETKVLVERHRVAVEKERNTTTKNKLNTTINEKKRKLDDTQGSLERMVALIEGLEVELEETREVNRAQRDTLCGLERHLKDQLQDMETARDDKAQQVECLESYLSMLQHLSGIKRLENDSKDRLMRVWIPGTPNQKEEELIITMRFRTCSKGLLRLKSAEVSCSTLEVEDLVTDAVERDDVPHLISALKERWQDPVHREIETLRKEYALDWLPEERLLRVINEQNAHIITTLHISNDYPAPGSIRLRGVEGIQDPPGADAFRLPGEACGDPAEGVKDHPGGDGGDPAEGVQDYPGRENNGESSLCQCLQNIRAYFKKMPTAEKNCE